MKNGPELWTALLALFPAGTIIAGGAVRDYLMDVEPKDIDVFITTIKLAELKDNVMPPLRLDAHTEAEEYLGFSNVDVVMQTTFAGYKVEVIGLDTTDITKVIDDFDFGITRSWFDTEIHDTYEARYDREKGTITCFNDERPERLWKRFDSFNERSGNSFTPVNFPARPGQDDLPF